MHYYPQSDSHIKDKIKLVLYLPNYATKKELNNAADVDTFDSAAKNILLL